MKGAATVSKTIFLECTCTHRTQCVPCRDEASYLSSFLYGPSSNPFVAWMTGPKWSDATPFTGLGDAYRGSVSRRGFSSYLQELGNQASGEFTL